MDWLVEGNYVEGLCADDEQNQMQDSIGRNLTAVAKKNGQFVLGSKFEKSLELALDAIAKEQEIDKERSTRLQDAQSFTRIFELRHYSSGHIQKENNKMQLSTRQFENSEDDVDEKIVDSIFVVPQQTWEFAASGQLVF